MKKIIIETENYTLTYEIENGEKFIEKELRKGNNIIALDFIRSRDEFWNELSYNVQALLNITNLFIEE